MSTKTIKPEQMSGFSEQLAEQYGLSGCITIFKPSATDVQVGICAESVAVVLDLYCALLITIDRLKTDLKLNPIITDDVLEEAATLYRKRSTIKTTVNNIQ